MFMPQIRRIELEGKHILCRIKNVLYKEDLMDENNPVGKRLKRF